MNININDYKVLTPIPQIYLIQDYITEAEETYLTKRIDQIGVSNQVVRPDLTISRRAGGWENLTGRRSMCWGGTLSPKGKLIPQNPPNFMTNEWPQVFGRLEQMNIFKSSRDLPSEGSQSALQVVPPNHCLVNEYKPGDGILPHTDGPAYLPTVATISLEADTLYDFYCHSDQHKKLSDKLATLMLNKNKAPSELEDNEEDFNNQLIHESQHLPSAMEPKPLFSLFVPRRSLIIIELECYNNLLHSIPARISDDLFLHLRPCVNWDDFSDLELDMIDNKLVRGRRLSLTCRRIEKVLKGLSNFSK